MMLLEKIGYFYVMLRSINLGKCESGLEKELRPILCSRSGDPFQAQALEGEVVNVGPHMCVRY